MRKHILIFSLVFIFLAVSFFNTNKSFASDTGYLGVYVQELSKPVKIALNLDYGLIVAEVAKDSPADKNGIKKGDVILNIDNKKIRDYNDLRNIVRDNPNKEVNVGIFTGGKKKNIKIKLSYQKDSFYKWKWEGESSPQDNSERMIFPFRFYHFNSEDIEKIREDIEELRENLENLYKELGKEYKKRENKEKNNEDSLKQKEHSGFDRFPREFYPYKKI